MTVQADLFQTWSEPKLLVFSRTGSEIKNEDVSKENSQNADKHLDFATWSNVETTKIPAVNALAMIYDDNF